MMGFDVLLESFGFFIIPNIGERRVFNITKNIAMAHFNVAIAPKKDLIEWRSAG